MHIRILDRWMGTPHETEELGYAADCYRYLLATAPPLAIERAHAEALCQLSSEQRHQVLRLLRHQLQAFACDFDHAPQALARLLTCAELRQPGTLERALGSACPSGVSGPYMFGTLARAFTATPIAQQFLGGIDYDGVATDSKAHVEPEQEFDYEALDYESPPLEHFFGRSGIAL